jgi:hypothetical protein
MFGVLRCEKDSAAQDSPQIVKTLAGDSAASQRRSVCKSAEFKSFGCRFGGSDEMTCPAPPRRSVLRNDQRFQKAASGLN